MKNTLFYSIFLLSLLVISSCANATTRLPAKTFGSLPDVTNATLSPDGKHLAFIVRLDGTDKKGSVVRVLDVDTLKAWTLLYTDNSKYKISWIDWANNFTIFASARYPAKIYNTPINPTRLLKINIDHKKVESAIPTRYLRNQSFIPVFQDRVIDYLDSNPDEFLVSLRTRNDIGTEIVRFNLTDNSSKRVQRYRSDINDWITDRNNDIRIAKYFKGTTHRILTKESAAKKWKTLWEYETFSEHSKTPLGFDGDPNILFYSAYHDGRKAIFKADISESPLQPELVYSHPRYDAGGTLIFSKKKNRVVGVRVSFGNGYKFWDDEFVILQNSLNKALPDTSNIILGFNRNEDRLLIKATNDIDAGTYYLWDRSKKTMTPLAYSYSRLTPELMTPKRYIKYKARDGLQISGYLTSPGDEYDGPKPTIIFPHGGPISYDSKGFDYWTQFFANRGYNVLQMNFRGSSGYGFDFMQSGLKGWGKQMQTDIEDGTRWLIEEEIADPQKICIVGASYGGYAALMEAASNSDLYKCAVSFAGVTDLPHLFETSRKYANHKVFKEQIGSNRKSLAQHSPVNFAKNIDIPILLVHGTKDYVVGIKHGRRMHKKLLRAGQNVHYVEQEGGDHYLSNEVHRIQLFEEMDTFLSKYLD